MNDQNGMPMMENYRYTHLATTTVLHGRNPVKNCSITHLFSSTTQEPQPSNTFHTATLKQHRKHVATGDIEK